MNRKSYLKILVAFFLLTMTITLFAQKTKVSTDIDNLTRLSKYDSIGLMNLPKLILPDEFKGPNAPLLDYMVDNSENIYWRPVFAQIQYECGQASSVGLGFTYTINRMRDLNSSDVDNQYPTHFAWNWANQGDGYYGVSYFHTFDMLKLLGTPDVNTYGGMYIGTGDERGRLWMNGYDKYYSAMHNRLAEAFQIDVSDEEGILTLKHWIDNYLEGDDVGGVANFYANAPGGMPTLPAGTPEGGKYVVTSWSSPNHGMTICGYNDSIRWDYNGDGQYTNHLDINNDGIVNVRDWEIGGLKFANTYSGGPSFGNNGFCYMTYKSLADPSTNGGIWNNAVHVQYAKASTEPLLTTRIIIKHNKRYKLRVRVGVSTDVNSDEPEFLMAFPVFDYQGGSYYMQGGSTEDDKTIEFGLDITPLANMIGTGTPARYFLRVDEDDSNGAGIGEIVHFSVIDYTNGVNEINCPETNVPINNNSKTQISVTHTVNYDEVNITDETLPAATVYEPYSFGLSATGGTAPYLWDFDLNFTETNTSIQFPNINNEQLNPSNNNDGYAVKELGFAFPFQGGEYDEVRVMVDGTIMFDNYFDWPYKVYDFFDFTKNKHIAPFYSDLRIYPAYNDGIWYEGDENSALFRWKVSVNGQAESSDLNFAVKLFSNGDIDFYYGNTNEYSDIEWISGLSDGENKYYQFSDVSNHSSIPANYSCEFEATHVPDGFQIDRYGNLNGMAQDNFEDFDIKFRVTDANNITSSKVLPFSTDGTDYIIIDAYSVDSGDDDIIEFGETAYITVDIKNIGLEAINGTEMNLVLTDDYITLTDDSEILGDFEPGETKTFAHAFSFDVDNLVPDDYDFVFDTQIAASSGINWDSHIFMTAYAPIVQIVGASDPDGSIDPGETTNIIVTLQNDGGATANNLIASLSTNDPLITINDNTATLNSLEANSIGSITFNISVSEDTPSNHILEFDVVLQADNDYYKTGQFLLVVGVTAESFETGNFTALPWEFAGDADWVIDGSIVFDGDYSARSGNINDNEYSLMTIDICTLTDSEISFYRKVSSEASYDYLKFYIDGIEKGAWDGEQNWSQVSFSLNSGIHNLSWTFEKDYSVSTGSDCGWVDLINFPPFGDWNPQMAISTDSLKITMQPESMETDSISITNEGTGSLAYSLEIVDGEEITWLSIDGSGFGAINPGSSNNELVSFNTEGLEEGVYEAVILITDHVQNEYEIPVVLTVDINIGVETQTETVSLDYNFPNPFTEETTIWFTLNENSITKLEIFNFNGQKVKGLLNRSNLNKGLHSVNWDGSNNSGAKMEPGIYLCKLTSGNQIYTLKMILTK
jgi:hypothetical protein